MRLSFYKNSANALEIVEENNYYPFGLKHQGYNELTGNPSYNYSYNGKELQTETGWSDYGARMYMADIGRWGVIDNKAEKYSATSPYVYALNNPVLFIDPDGNEVYCPSCKTKADWDLYIGYWDNTLSMMGGNLYTGTGIPSHIQVSGGLTEDMQFHPTVTVNGEVQDLPAIANRSRLDVFGEYYAPIVDIAGLTFIKSSSWFTRNIINPVKSLFSSGNSEVSTMDDLTTAVKNTAADLKSTGKAPATVVGAELNGKTAIATSGTPPSKIAPQLQNAADKIGGVGTKTASGNTVGCCAEFKAANELLIKNPSATPQQVNFTEAIRPRTGQTIPMCENCNATFGK